MMKSAWALLLYLPATVFAQTALDGWYGQWTAHYSGGDSGTCSITISSSTATQAAVSGSCVSDYSPITILVSGKVTPDGTVTLTAGTTSTGAQFTGILQGTSGSGQWVNSYYGISGTWTISKTAHYALAVTKSGTGSGTVTSSPHGINCGTECSESFTGGTSVSLSATPASGSHFYGWSGACSGTGSCVVTMDAAKSVIAIFKPKPFVATTTSIITATSATITATIAFNAPDVGKSGAVYVTSWAPANGLGSLGILTAPMSRALSVTTTRDNPYLGGAVNTRQETLAAFLAAADPNAFVLVQLTSSGWQLVQGGQLIPYASGVLGAALSSLNILNNANPANLTGAQFCVGYGTSAAEMIAAGRMMPVATIPGAAIATNGSCNVADVVVEFYNTNLDHYFITADANEAAAIDSGSAGPGWSRTGNSFKSGGSTSVCRFYGSQLPGPNSHFYTVDVLECAGLQQLQASTPATEKRWNFESLDFVSTPPVTGTCPAGTMPVYRAYNNGFAKGVDSNHRITGSLTAIQEVVTRGWSDEGVVMCAPN